MPETMKKYALRDRDLSRRALCYLEPHAIAPGVSKVGFERVDIDQISSAE